MEHIYPKIIETLEKGEQFVLGTLIKTKGSTPQVQGASAIFNSKGLILGTMGGGPLEANAAKKSVHALASNKNLLEEYNLDGNTSDAKEAICGGAAVFLLDANPEKHLDVFSRVQKSLAKRVGGVLITVIEKEQNNFSVLRFWFSNNEEIPCDFYESYGLGCEELQRIVINRKPFLLETNNKENSGLEKIVFAEPVFPEPELLIVGAGHIGKALCHLGNFAGFRVTVADSRPELATKKRFPDAQKIFVNDLTDSFSEITITENTHIVIATHGHQEDAKALQYCIRSKASYIGMLGSERKIALLKKKFIEEKICTETEFSRVFAPVGIDIHSETVQEIAVSIVAQLIKVRKEKTQNTAKKEVWCVVLAAGQSTRMKQQKLLLPYQNKTIIKTVVGKAGKSQADKVMVILGSQKEKIRNEIGHPKSMIVENINYANGMLSSVQCGINAMPEKVGAAIIMLGDQPTVKTEVIDQLITVFNKSSEGIIIPVFRGKRGHPILIDLKFRKEINNLKGNIGLRELMLNHPNEIKEIEVLSDEILNDIDTPEDYKKLK